MIDKRLDSPPEISDEIHAVEVEFTPRIFPWLKESQSDSLFSLKASDGKTVGLIGSCIERGSKLEKVADSLNEQESERANFLFIRVAQVYLGYLAGTERLNGSTLHFIDPKPGCPPIKCVVNGKLRVFFVDVRLKNDIIAIVKIGTCRKQNEEVVLAEISSNPRANIR